MHVAPRPLAGHARQHLLRQSAWWISPRPRCTLAPSQGQGFRVRPAAPRAELADVGGDLQRTDCTAGGLTGGGTGTVTMYESECAQVYAHTVPVQMRQVGQSAARGLHADPRPCRCPNWRVMMHAHAPKVAAARFTACPSHGTFWHPALEQVSKRIAPFARACACPCVCSGGRVLKVLTLIVDLDGPVPVYSRHLGSGSHAAHLAAERDFELLAVASFFGPHRTWASACPPRSDAERRAFFALAA